MPYALSDSCANISHIIHRGGDVWGTGKDSPPQNLWWRRWRCLYPLQYFAKVTTDCHSFSIDYLLFLANVLRYVRYMLSAVRLLSVCCLSVCDVGAPYSGG